MSRCYNTAQFYCDARYLLLIQLGFIDKSNNPDLERCLPPPPDLVKHRVTKNDETAWWHSFGGEEALDSTFIKATWGTKAAFESAATQVEQIRLAHGYISLRQWREDVWGTEQLARDGEPMKIANAGSGAPHTWNFDTFRYPPFPFVKYMSERIRHVPIRIVAYGSGWPPVRYISYFAGHKLRTRVFRRIVQQRGFH